MCETHHTTLCYLIGGRIFRGLPLKQEQHFQMVLRGLMEDGVRCCIVGVLKTDHILEIEVSLWCISLQGNFFLIRLFMTLWRSNKENIGLFEGPQSAFGGPESAPRRRRSRSRSV